MLSILCHVEKYPPCQNSGAESYLHSINKFLVSRGHKVKVMLWNRPNEAAYEWEGVQVIPSDNHWGSHIVDSDIVVTHLDATFDTWKMVKRKPILWICHSGFDFPTVRTNRQINVLYNGKAIVGLCNYPNPHYILPPPVDIDYFNVCADPSKNEYITLVNLNENKGGRLFWKLAAAMPEQKFLGVRGYGPQIEGNLPNVTVIDNTPEMREVYKKTRILLMPSLYESYGMAALEAMASGIPVLAHESFGTRENLSDAGIFLHRDQEQQWIDMIKQLKGKAYKEASAKARKRAEEQRPHKNLEAFEDHLHKIAGKQKVNHIPKAEHGHIPKSEFSGQ